MILGVGIDIVENDRMEKILANKILGEEELKFFEKIKAGKSEYLASRFAAKEAFFKAIGTGVNGFSFKDAQILNDSHGRPCFSFSRKVEDLLKQRGVFKVHLSISHEKKYSIAVVIIEGKN